MRFRIGYCAPDMYPPGQLADFCRLTEENGFDDVWVGDHFHPWVHTGAQASFCWILLAVVAERTRSVTLGSNVTVPILRYHPAIVAQAFATLGNLYPGRVILGLGAGQAMNEVPIGYEWPKSSERMARLEEAITIIKLLWEKEFVSMKGKYYTLRKANLYTKPSAPIPIYLGLGGPKMATLAGKYADGIVTVNIPADYYRSVISPAIEEGARLAGRDSSSIYRGNMIDVVYDADYGAALETCKKWGAGVLPFFSKLKVYDPREIEECGKFVDPKELTKVFLISTDPDDHIRRIESYIKLGFSGAQIFNSGPNQEALIKMYGRTVIPYLKDNYGSE